MEWMKDSQPFVKEGKEEEEPGEEVEVFVHDEFLNRLPFH